MKTILTALAILAAATAHGDEAWKYIDSTDDLTGKAYRAVVLADAEGQGFVVVRVDQGQNPEIRLGGVGAIKPDNVGDRSMNVAVAFRATSMTAPKTQNWGMRWMDYDTAQLPATAKTVRALFADDKVVFQFLTQGKRITIPTAQKEWVGARQAIEKALEIAGQSR